MGYNIAAYVEHKNKDTGNWELVTEKPISTCLKYIFDDYQEFPKLEWDNLSQGLKDRYQKETNSEGKEVCYYNFYTKTPQELEDSVSREIKDIYTRLNVVVKALGCQRVYSDEGDELEPWGDDEPTEKLTFPINKQLVEELQYGYESIRKVGQKEAFDLLLSEYMQYDEEYRIVFVLT